MKTSRRRSKRPNLTNMMPVISSCSMSYASSMTSMDLTPTRLVTSDLDAATTGFNSKLKIESKFKFNQNSVYNTLREKQHQFSAGTEIIPGKLYLTSLDEAENINYLKSKKVTAVLTINCEPSKLPVEMEKSGGMKTRFINLGDNCTSQIKNYFEEIIDFINDNECVLVHCHAGISRSATAVLAYMMKSYKLTLNEALMFVRSKRHIICPNFSFMGQLKSYETKLMELEVNERKKKKEENNLVVDFELEYKLQVATNINDFDSEEANPIKVIPKLVLSGDHDSGVDTSESSNESPLGSPKNKVQKIEFDNLQRNRMRLDNMK
jgi:hypothetical protein